MAKVCQSYWFVCMPTALNSYIYCYILNYNVHDPVVAAITEEMLVG